MNCLLIDRVPTTVEIDGVDYEIYSDFRIGILFEMLMCDREYSDSEKIMQALELYYPVIPADVNAAVEKILWFYQGETTEYTSKSGGKRANQIYSYEHDAEYIYAAFLDQYGINLQQVDYLHWWEFKALFKGLKSDNEIVKIMGFRAMEIDRDMSKKEQKYYRKMKEMYKIPLPKSDVEKLDEINQILMGDGDLSQLL